MENLIFTEECLSTNDEILIPLSSNNNDFLALYTFKQTKGRGQYGNTWEIIPNQNLAFSLAISCDKINISDCMLSFHTANILRQFIANKVHCDINVKWPNDIIVFGKKISGILIEKRKIENKHFYIIGMGINILQKDFHHLPKAGSIFTQTKKEFGLHDWAKEMYIFFKQHFFKNLEKEYILKKYNETLFRKEQVSVFKIQKIQQNGIIKKADEQGFLWVDLENDGLKKFFHKELELLY